MPKWVGKWKGGRVYLNEDGKPVFVIERRGGAGIRYAIKLKTHDADLAVGQLATFLADPAAFAKAMQSPTQRPTFDEPVWITSERVNLYMNAPRKEGGVRDAVDDHRKARRAYLLAWANTGIDLRAVDREGKARALASFEGGHSGRTEALNAFARFLVKRGDLAAWAPLVNTFDEAQTRAERQAYTVEQLRAKYAELPSQALRDVFRLRVKTGMHQTEIDQLFEAVVTTGPLPNDGVAIRKLDGKHEIAGVIQITHKNQKRHRQPVDAAGLAAALRLTEWVPGRVHVWEAFKPLVPSNLRHTFATLCLEVGRKVTYQQGGIDPIQVQRAMGHAVGSSMLRDRYAQVQVPTMNWLPIKLTHPDDPKVKAVRRRASR